MKTATAFLVAVTVFTSLFLESSTAPNLWPGGIAEGLGNLGTKVGTNTGKLVSDTGKGVGGLVNGVGKLANDVVETVTTKAAADLKTVTQVVGKIVKDVTGLLGGLLEKVEAFEGKLGEKLKKALTKAEGTLKEVIELAENIINTAADDANDTVKELDHLLKKAVQKLEARLGAVLGIVKEISEKAGDDASVVVNEVKAVVAKVTEGVKNILNNVNEAVKSKTTKAVDGAKKLDQDALRQLLEKEIKSSEAALAAVGKTVEDILATATDAEKENLAAVVDFLKKYIPFVNGIREKLREDVKVNNPEYRKKMIKEITEAIKYTKTQVASLIKTQGDKVKEALEKNILKTIMNIADNYVKVLQNTLSA